MRDLADAVIENWTAPCKIDRRCTIDRLLDVGWIDAALAHRILTVALNSNLKRTDGGIHRTEWLLSKLQDHVEVTFYHRHKKLHRWSHVLSTDNLLRLYAPRATTRARQEWLVHKCTLRGKSGKWVTAEIVRRQARPCVGN